MLKARGSERTWGMLTSPQTFVPRTTYLGGDESMAPAESLMMI